MTDPGGGLAPPAVAPEPKRPAWQQAALSEGVAREQGMALLALGELGDREATEQAVSVLRDSPAKLEYARALVLYTQSIVAFPTVGAPPPYLP